MKITAEDSEKAAKNISDQIAAGDTNEGTIVAIKYTLDGEVPIVRKDGKDYEAEIPPEEFEGLPDKWTGVHTEAMGHIFWGIEQAKKFKSRQMPLTRGECIEMGISKKTLKDLEEAGLIAQTIIKVFDHSTNKSAGARMVVYFTPQGRAYLRERIEKTKEKINAVEDSDI